MSMLKKLIEAMTVKPTDTQIWECSPLMIIDQNGETIYWQETNVEFTPFEIDAPKVGHAVALTPDKSGVCPELTANSQQHVDSPIELARRPGIILMGLNQMDEPSTWLINGEADRHAKSGELLTVEYDEETAKQLEEELDGEEPGRFSMNSPI